MSGSPRRTVRSTPSKAVLTEARARQAAPTTISASKTGLRRPTAEPQALHQRDGACFELRPERRIVGIADLSGLAIVLEVPQRGQRHRVTRAQVLLGRKRVRDALGLLRVRPEERREHDDGDDKGQRADGERDHRLSSRSWRSRAR